MIIIGERAYLKNYDAKVDQEANFQSEVGKLVTIQNEEISNKKIKRKENKNTNNDIYKNIKNKASILNKDHRNIQDEISLIQAQEQKVDEMENILNQVKSTYIQAIENGKQEETNQKIKIRKILKEVNDLDNEYEEKNNYEYVSGDKNILSTVDDALRRINDIKNKLMQYKAKLISLENNVNKSKKEVEAAEKNIQQVLSSGQCINEKIILNPLDFIFVEGSIETGIIINILV